MSNIVYKDKKSSKTAFPSRKRSKISNRKPPNRHSLESNFEAVLTLATKIKTASNVEDLTRDDFLSRCLGGYTQNANESLNSIVWSIAPKAISSGKDIIDIATDIAVITFNDGFQGILEIMKILQLKIGHECYNFCIEIDERRVKAANRSSSKTRKDARKDLTSLRKEAEEQHLDREGLLYGPGIAE